MLVLINGKRRHQSALVHLNNSIGRGSTGVDLNAIPLAAIDHIEVLRDGAAAQYGSDAIAGVINIVLAGGVTRPSVSANVGVSTGSFAGNRCTPNGLSCSVGEDISFSDGDLADLAGSWGIGVAQGSITVSASTATTIARTERQPTRETRLSREMRAPMPSRSRTIAGVIPTRGT